MAYDFGFNAGFNGMDFNDAFESDFGLVDFCQGFAKGISLRCFLNCL